MAHREVIPTRSGRYGTRMLTAGEPITVSGPLAREMIALNRAVASDGRPRRAKIAAPAPASANGTTLADARKAHKAKFGKLPGPKATVEQILAKIAAA